MTVKEMFEAKYKECMATINRREWDKAVRCAAYMGMPVYEYIMKSIAVTQFDLAKWGGCSTTAQNWSNCTRQSASQATATAKSMVM